MVKISNSIDIGMCIIVVWEMFPVLNNDIKSNPLRSEHNKVKITRFKF